MISKRRKGSGRATERLGHKCRVEAQGDTLATRGEPHAPKKDETRVPQCGAVFAALIAAARARTVALAHCILWAFRNADVPLRRTPYTRRRAARRRAARRRAARRGRAARRRAARRAARAPRAARRSTLSRAARRAARAPRAARRSTLPACTCKRAGIRSTATHQNNHYA